MRHWKTAWLITIASFIFLALVSGWLHWGWRQGPGLPSEPRNGKREKTPGALTLSGVISAKSAVEVTAGVTGVIQALYCETGMKVEAGQLCAKIDPRPFQAAVDRIKASLLASEMQLKKEVPEIDRARANLKRYHASVRRKAVSRRKLDRLRKTYHKALMRAKSTEMIIAQRASQMRAAESDIERTNVTSPMDGTVISRGVDVGESVLLGREVMFMIAAPKTEIEARVSGDDIAHIAIGDRVSIVADPATPTTIGRVAGLSRAADAAQNGGHYNLVVDAPNPDGLLKPGLKVTIQIAPSLP